MCVCAYACVRMHVCVCVSVHARVSLMPGIQAGTAVEWGVDPCLSEQTDDFQGRRRHWVSHACSKCPWSVIAELRCPRTRTPILSSAIQYIRQQWLEYRGVPYSSTCAHAHTALSCYLSILGGWGGHKPRDLGDMDIWCI